MKGERLPELTGDRTDRRGRAEAQAKDRQLWLRIAAFLSTKSSNTQRTYLGILEEWCDFLKIRFGDPAASSTFCNAEELHAIAYRRWLEGQPGQKPRLDNGAAATTKEIATKPKRVSARDGLQTTLANATISKKFAALRRVYRLAISAGLGVKSNPFASEQVAIASAKSGQKRPTEMFPFDLVNQILSLPDLSQPKGVQDCAILALLFGGGLRRSEVLRLRLGDLRCTSNGTVFVHLRSTKSGKDADQALPEWAASSVQQLLQTRLLQGAKEADYLVISYRGKGGLIPTDQPLSESGLYRLFKRYCQLVGAGRFLTPHSARATAITKLLADGVPHREVQEFSRHSSIQMVEIYDKRRYGIDKNPAKGLRY